MRRAELFLPSFLSFFSRAPPPRQGRGVSFEEIRRVARHGGGRGGVLLALCHFVLRRYAVERNYAGNRALFPAATYARNNIRGYLPDSSLLFLSLSFFLIYYIYIHIGSRTRVRKVTKRARGIKRLLPCAATLVSPSTVYSSEILVGEWGKERRPWKRARVEQA